MSISVQPENKGRSIRENGPPTLPAKVLRLVWLLAPLAVLVFALALGYSSLASMRNDHWNGASGDIVAGRQLGQQLVARYNNLDGVELKIAVDASGTVPADLVMHLRAAPGNGPDIATATLHAGDALTNGEWHMFAFPAIAQSENRSFYVQLESPSGRPGHAPAVFLWSGATGDPYAPGSAFESGKPVPGDLTFGLHYSASPIEMWLQTVRAASVSVPLPLLAAIVALLGGLLALAGCALYPRMNARHLRGRQSLLLVLGIAFANGLLYVLLVPAWQGPDEHAHFTYVALLDRYGLNGSLVQAKVDAGGEVDAPLVQAISASLDRHNYTRLLAGHLAPGAPANMGQSYFWEVRQPPAYYLTCAVALRAARALGFRTDPYTEPDNALLVMRLVSLGLSVVVAALAWLAAKLLVPAQPRAWLLVPLTVSLFPMHAFVGGVANNDILAELVVTALFVAVVALLKHPFGLRGLALFVLGGVLTLLSVAAKSTATSAALPLFALGCLVWLTQLAAHLPVGGRRLLQLAAVFIVPIGAVAFALFGFYSDGTAAGWHVAAAPQSRVARILSSTAHEGQAVLQVGQANGVTGAEQTLIPSVYHPATVMTFTIWARLASPGTLPATASIGIVGSRTHEATAAATLPPGGEWVRLQTTAHVPAGSTRIVARFGVGDAATTVQFDDASLAAEWRDPMWQNSAYIPRLVNPSAEIEGRSLHSGIARVLPDEGRQIASTLANPQPFSEGVLWRGYVADEYRSYWGNFGWVSLPLSEGAYRLAGAVSLLALLGLAWRGARRLGRRGAAEWASLVSLLALIAAIAISVARQTALLALSLSAAYPQGRYLFVLAVPAGWLLVAGLGALVQEVGRLLSRGVVSDDNSSVQAASARSVLARLSRVGPWLWLNMLLLFFLYCMLGLIVPYYYG